MLREKLLFACFTSFVVFLPPVACLRCASSCGNFQNISYPFRLKDDPPKCGHPSYELSCENNSRTIVEIDSAKYYVEEVNYSNLTMRVVYAGIERDACSGLRLYYYSLTEQYPTNNNPYSWEYYNAAYISFISCATPVNSSLYLDIALCNTSLNSSSLFLQRHTYAVYGYIRISDVEDSCTIAKVVYGPWPSNDGQMINNNISLSSFHDILVSELHLSWKSYEGDGELGSNICHLYGWCPYVNCDRKFPTSLRCIKEWLLLIGLVCLYVGGGSILYVVAARTLCGSPCVFAFLVYKWRRRHLSVYDNIEEFIQSHNKLKPVRFSYSDIRKITKGFKDKLGEGGYGSVFKGKLRSGLLVAVKVLGNSKANGQDFINEVATIGTIHHVNVAQLIGFCAESSKRALVYDFMPNGSLEKYIFPREEGIKFLSFEKLYAISLGIARGIEYLHGGCDMQILHFDIKPHNILLDEKFTPKVSDFGLAKLYPTDDSIVNLTAARGTMGYMAPELFYKNIGGVSYKADVYSFGMLLMEMGSKRKNLNPFVEHLSQIYFPSWVYDQFSEGNDIEMGDVTEEERKIAKKMIIVAFWCIQLKPTDRPAMSKVVEMLEGNVELEMPPKPFLSPQEILVEDHGININPTELSISSGDSTDTISLIANAI